MNPISRGLTKVARRLDAVLAPPDAHLRSLPPLRPELAAIKWSGRALQKLLDDFTFDTVLDVGSGDGSHSEAFRAAGKQVTSLDYGESLYFKQRRRDIDAIVADFNTFDFGRTFDAVWCSHVLEHQLNVQGFLEKVHALTNEGGVVAITVPPLKHKIVGGHVSLWNAGLLLYRLVLAGFDCREASVLSYGYNVSVLVRKRTISVLGAIDYDTGDIRKIRAHLPPGLRFQPTEHDDPFDGDIAILNW